MTNTQEPANWKYISSLREENHAKTQIIKQLTDMKVAPSNSDITTGTWVSFAPNLYQRH